MKQLLEKLYETFDYDTEPQNLVSTHAKWVF